jgi:hypothetical protein
MKFQLADAVPGDVLALGVEEEADDKADADVVDDTREPIAE